LGWGKRREGRCAAMVESLFWNLGHQSHSPTLILAGGIFDTAASSESFAMDFFYHFIYQFLQTTSLFLNNNNNNSSDQTLIRPIRLTN